MIKSGGKTIAVDFDGTIVEHAYPEIGEEMLFAFDTLKALQQKGHKLILWTIREGDLLEEAVKYCKERGVEFYAVNKNYPEEDIANMDTRKILVDIFIDDRNIGGFPGWPKVWEMLHPGSGQFKHELINPQAHRNKTEHKSFFKRLFGK
jgi:hypothetical protein